MAETAEMLQNSYASPELLDDPEILQIPRITQLVLKVASRCDYDCKYCYVYNLGDKSYLEQPRFMSLDTVRATAQRLGEYLRDNPMLEFTITFHGGEPLLVPDGYYDAVVPIFLDAVKEHTNNATALNFNMQDNGRRLPQRLPELLRNRIRVGISLDGDREANDRFRVSRGKQESTYDDTVKGIYSMIDNERTRKLFSGILAVMDIRNDPGRTFNALMEFEPPSIDFLLPHGHWNDMPYGLETDTPGMRTEETPYGDWYNEVFDLWYPNRMDKTRIRVFDSVLAACIGRRSSVQSIGDVGDIGLAVIQTDGSYELVDALSATPGRVARTGLNVRKHSLERAAHYMAKKAKLLGISEATAQCRECPVIDRCGRGYEVHRYQEDPGTEKGKGDFRHPSVYCDDLAAMATHVKSRLYGQAELMVLYRANRLNQETARQVELTRMLREQHEMGAFRANARKHRALARTAFGSSS